MFDLFKEMIVQFEALPMPVLLWVSWMGFIFALAFFYARERKAAQFAILTFFVFTFLGAGIAFYLMGSIHWIAVVHLIVWPPLLYYLLVHEVRSSGFRPKSTYGLWVILLIATMVVSLLFDIRDAAHLVMVSN